jgi:hypothetical protein
MNYLLKFKEKIILFIIYTRTYFIRNVKTSLTFLWFTNVPHILKKFLILFRLN